MAWLQTADGEEGDETDWDSVTETGSATLDVSTAAKKNGSYGWEVTINDADKAYGELSDATTDTTATFETWFDPNSMTYPTASFYFMALRDASAANDSYQWHIGYDGSDYYIKQKIRTDTAGFTDGVNQTLTDGWHVIRGIWKAATGAGNDDGYANLYIDYDLVDSITGVDNDARDYDTIYIGAFAGLDTGASGSFYLDDCRWTDSVYLADIDIEFTARYHDYNLNAPQRFTISGNAVQMTARYRDYYLTAPEKEEYG